MYQKTVYFFVLKYLSKYDTLIQEADKPGNKRLKKDNIRKRSLRFSYPELEGIYVILLYFKKKFFGMDFYTFCGSISFCRSEVFDKRNVNRNIGV